MTVVVAVNHGVEEHIELVSAHPSNCHFETIEPLKRLLSAFSITSMYFSKWQQVGMMFAGRIGRWHTTGFGMFLAVKLIH